MNEIVKDSSLVSFCGLYCGSCSKYIKGKCPGCAENEKASWCKVRSCCIEKNISNCSECKEYGDISQCKKLNNFMSKFFALVFKSDRIAGLQMIKEKGIDEFMHYMSEHKLVALKKGAKEPLANS